MTITFDIRDDVQLGLKSFYLRLSADCLPCAYQTKASKHVMSRTHQIEGRQKTLVVFVFLSFDTDWLSASLSKAWLYIGTMRIEMPSESWPGDNPSPHPTAVCWWQDDALTEGDAENRPPSYHTE